MNPLSTVDELLKSCQDDLGQHKVPQSELRILLGHIMNLDPAGMILAGDRQLSRETVEEFKSLLKARAEGVPIAYLTGKREFWSLELAIDDRALIPRHETEILVERVLAHAVQMDAPGILELGTGCGAIALAIATELPGATVTATDISNKALALAEENRHKLGIGNLRLLNSDWYEGLKGRGYNIVCSNPPYIDPADDHLGQGDLRFEPRGALVAERGGYACLQKIISGARGCLGRDGWLLLEHGYDQGDEVRHILAQSGFSEVRTTCDLGGNERVSEGRLI